MTAQSETNPTTIGQALVNELLWIHDKIRHDLDVIRELSARVLSGVPAAQVEAEITRLQSKSPLWQLRVNCLYYCRFVHMHHSLEDFALFPELRRANPELNPVVDKLEADHRQVSDYLDEIEALTRGLGRSDTHPQRQQLVDALEGLAEHLLAHLEYEEIHVSPTLLQFTDHPLGQGT